MLKIAVINHKGGVGKTTTTLNLAHALALQNLRVTALDLDPQGDLTASAGLHAMDTPGIVNALLDKQPLTGLIQHSRPQLQLIPAGIRLREIEHIAEFPRDRLSNILQGQLTDQQCVLMDCPPASGALIVNALLAAETALVPVAGDYLALHGLSHLISTLQQFEQTLGKKIPFWIVITRYKPRQRLAKEVLEKLTYYFPGRILATPIRETVALAEAPSFGKTIFEYKPKSIGATDYQNLAQDLLQRRTLT